MAQIGKLIQAADDTIQAMNTSISLLYCSLCGQLLENDWSSLCLGLGGAVDGPGAPSQIKNV